MSEAINQSVDYEAVAATTRLRTAVLLYEMASKSQDYADTASRRASEMLRRMEAELDASVDALAGQRLALIIAKRANHSTRTDEVSPARRLVVTVEVILPPVDGEELRAVIVVSDTDNRTAGFLGMYNHELYLWEDPSLLALAEPTE